MLRARVASNIDSIVEGGVSTGLQGNWACLEKLIKATAGFLNEGRSGGAPLLSAYRLQGEPLTTGVESRLNWIASVKVMTQMGFALSKNNYCCPLPVLYPVFYPVFYLSFTRYFTCPLPSILPVLYLVFYLSSTRYFTRPLPGILLVLYTEIFPIPKGFSNVHFGEELPCMWHVFPLCCWRCIVEACC